MGKAPKAVEVVRRHRGGRLRFTVLRRYLEWHGWALIRISGSHHVFNRLGQPRPFPVPVQRGKVDEVYVREAKRLCGETGQG